MFYNFKKGDQMESEVDRLYRTTLMLLNYILGFERGIGSNFISDSKEFQEVDDALFVILTKDDGE